MNDEQMIYKAVDAGLAVVQGHLVDVCGQMNAALKAERELPVAIADALVAVADAVTGLGDRVAALEELANRPPATPVSLPAVPVTPPPLEIVFRSERVKRTVQRDGSGQIVSVVEEPVGKSAWR